MCPVCGQGGIKVAMIEKYDTLTCPACQLLIYDTSKSPLPRFQDTWIKNSEEIDPLIRPAINLNDFANPKLFFLYEDCYQSLLIGRYNASIVLMGVLVEAIMKERILLKLGIEFTKPYGPCLKKIREEKLMDPLDILFLERFKDQVRNLYQHVDYSQILQGIFVKAWPIKFEKPSFAAIEQGLADIKSGRIKPIFIPAAYNKIVQPIIKQEHDKQFAIDLFNNVFDFLLIARYRYFRDEDYKEHRAKFGSSL